MMNGQEKLKVLEINSLLDKDFFIPTYQRGYRWTTVEVENLLEDIWEYHIKNKNVRDESFYCLQPIIVKEIRIKDENKWELIDGQQRMTTILLILHYWNEYHTKTPFDNYTIDFATRDHSDVFLSKITDEKLARNNVDYYHMHNAYKTIINWFKELNSLRPTNAGKFIETLIEEVKVIWYEIEKSDSINKDDVIDIFSRTNLGKIPLTNSELIKALILKKSNFNENSTYQQLRIANEWNEVEKSLQEDSFWYFLIKNSNAKNYSNRIEYLLDLIKDRTIDDELYYTFKQFASEINETKSATEIWLEIKNYFQKVKEWYNDSELYHLIGFLIEYDFSIDKLKKLSEASGKKEFVSKVKDKIKSKLNHIDISQLDYRSNPHDIKMVLLLFNIETINSNSDSTIRFPFDLYKKENWDIEHIHSQEEFKVDRNNWKLWIGDILEYFTGINPVIKSEQDDLKEVMFSKIKKLNDSDSNLCTELYALVLTDTFNLSDCQSKFAELRIRFKEDLLVIDHSISNLALLDSKTNRSYKNAIFPIKRLHIIKNDTNGTFVPICTKNLFLKYYSKELKNLMYWNESDANDYVAAIENVLTPYLQTD